MADEQDTFDWKQWLAKQGFVSVLLVGVLIFFRQDVWVPVRSALDAQTEILRGISTIQVQIRDDQRKGTWRSVEPPSPNELPKGVEPAKPES